jgi:co-chaperonin GroES (HSP10)
VGALVKDPNIKAAKGKICLFHPTVGWEIEYEGVFYLVLHDHEIIGLP